MDYTIRHHLSSAVAVHVCRVCRASLALDENIRAAIWLKIY